MANNLLQQAQQLKIMIDQVRQQSMVAKDAALQQQRVQLEKEKQEVRCGLLQCKIASMSGNTILLQWTLTVTKSTVHSLNFVITKDLLQTRFYITCIFSFNAISNVV